MGFGKSLLAATLMNASLLAYAQTQKIPVHIWLPDAFRPGTNFSNFLVERIRPHCLTMVESVLVEAFRVNGGWLHPRRNGASFRRKRREVLSTEVRLLQQDFPRLGVILFGRRQRLVDSALPVLTLCDFNQEEQRKLPMLTFGNEGRCSSFFQAMPSSLRRLASVPLLLVRFVKGYTKSGRIPVHSEELFSDWLMQLLSKWGMVQAPKLPHSASDGCSCMDDSSEANWGEDALFMPLKQQVLPQAPLTN